MAEPISLSILIAYISCFLFTYMGVLIILVYLNNRRSIEKETGTKKWGPMVSVVIPVYNEEEHICKCIDSVIALDYPSNKLEIVIVDDGSTDNTLKVLEKYKGKGVKIYSKKNGGPADAKNYGISKAKGEIIATLDSDSFVTPSTLKLMLPLFNEDNVASVIAAVKVYKPKNFLEKIQYLEYSTLVFIRKVLMSIDCISVTPGPFSLFRKNVLDEIGGFDAESLTEDDEIALNIQRHNYKIRSSWGAVAYTVAPSDFATLMKQRVRWIRGGTWDRIKHWKMLHPKYGDFVPIGILLHFTYLIPIAIYLVTFFNLFNLNSILIRPEGVMDMALAGINALQIVGVLIITMGVSWTLYAYWKTEKKTEGNVSINPLMVFAYSFLYIQIWVIAWIIVIFKEIKGEKKTWGTR